MAPARIIDSTDDRYIWVREGRAFVRVRRVMGAGASVIPPPTLLGADPSKVGREFSGASPATGASIAAAREDHTHGLGKSSRIAKAFGNAVHWQLGSASPSPPAYGYLMSTAVFPALAQWTLEGWFWGAGQTGNTAQGAGFGWQALASGAGGTGDIGVAGFTGFTLTGELVANGVDTGLSIWPAISSASPVHVAITYDGASLRYFNNGALVGSFVTAAGAIPAGRAFGLADHVGFLNLYFDELRISSVARYVAAFVAPVAPFVSDASTVALYHCDDFPPGQVTTFSSAGVTPFTQYPAITYDDSAAGLYPLMLQFVQTGGSLNVDTLTLSGLTSLIGGVANNGILAAAAVTSLGAAGAAALTGDVVLDVLPGGAIALSESGQTIVVGGNAIPDPTTAVGDILYKPADTDYLIGLPASGPTYGASSDDGAGARSWFIGDGSDATYWQGQFGNPNNWVSVDLGSVNNVGKVRAVTGSITNYTLEYSSDRVSWTVLTTRTPAGTGSDVESYPVAETAARYWRLFAHTGGSRVYTLSLFAPNTYPTRLPIGAAGQVLGVVGGLPSWAASGQTLIQKIGPIAAAQATFDFTAIPQTYSGLVLLFLLRSVAAQATDNLFLQCNADAAANYDFTEFYLNNAVMTLGALTGFSAVKAGIMPAGTFTAGRAARGRIEIPWYADATFAHEVLSDSALHDSGNNANSYLGKHSGAWRTLGAVNRVTLSTATGANFAIGSAVALYGVT